MKLALSTSSPVVSVALWDDNGHLMMARQRRADRSASAATAELVEEALAACDKTLADVTTWAVDVGPGGFTSVRVGVTMAKTWAWATGAGLASVSAFDLMPGDVNYVPGRRGTVLLRQNGEVEAVSTPPVGAVGYGAPDREDIFPLAERVDWAALSLGSPLPVVPDYVNPPRISLPKDPRVLGGQP